jgi:hypothetical protein
VIGVRCGLGGGVRIGLIGFGRELHCRVRFGVIGSGHCTSHAVRYFGRLIEGHKDRSLWDCYVVNRGVSLLHMICSFAVFFSSPSQSAIGMFSVLFQNLPQCHTQSFFDRPGAIWLIDFVSAV